MATKKITDLVEITTAASDDVLPIVDVSLDITNKITTTNLLKSKQDVLVSGTNIKTINSTSLLGSGNIDVAADWGDIGGTLSNQTDLQSALDGKQATITGGATSITSSDLTVSRALVSDGSGKVAVSDVTSTELGYLDGVTSAVQTQLDTKIAKYDGTTYDVNALAAVSQAEYDALTPSATTLYFII